MHQNHTVVTVHDVIRVLRSKPDVAWSTKGVAAALGCSVSQARRRLDVARIYEYIDVEYGPRKVWLWKAKA